jgi:hypothetical protein
MIKNEPLQSRRLIFKVLGIGCFLFCAALLSAPANATEYNVNFDCVSGATSLFDIGTPSTFFGAGQAFVASSSGQLNSFSINHFYKYGDPIDQVQLWITQFEDPDWVPIAWAQVDSSLIGTDNTASITFNFTAAVSLEAGRKYRTYVIRTGELDGSNYYRFVADNMSSCAYTYFDPYYPSATYFYSGGVIEAAPANDAYFKYDIGTNIVEPPTATSTVQYYDFDGAGSYVIPDSITCYQSDASCHMKFTFSDAVFFRNVEQSAAQYSTSTYSWYWPDLSGSILSSSNLHIKIWETLIGIAQPGANCTSWAGCPIMTNFPREKLLTIDFTFPTPTSTTAYTLKIADNTIGTRSFKVWAFLIAGSSPGVGAFCDNPCAGLATSTSALNYDNFICGLNKFGCRLIAAPSDASISYMANKFQIMTTKFPLAPFARAFYDLNLAATGTQDVAPGVIEVPFWSTSSQQYVGQSFDLGSSTLSHSYAWTKFRRLEVIVMWCVGILPSLLILIRLIL